MKPFASQEVAEKFAEYPPAIQYEMFALRELILDTAAGIEAVGEIEETLKWDEPAYVTAKSKSGSTVRIDWKEKQPDQYAMYFNCQTNLIETFRTLFPTEFKFDGNRAIVFGVGSKLPTEAVGQCVSAALTYHLRKGGPAIRKHGVKRRVRPPKPDE